MVFVETTTENHILFPLYSISSPSSTSLVFVFPRSVANKTFRVLRGASWFCIFLWFLYHPQHIDDVCKPNT